MLPLHAFKESITQLHAFKIKYIMKSKSSSKQLFYSPAKFIPLPPSCYNCLLFWQGIQLKFCFFSSVSRWIINISCILSIQVLCIAYYWIWKRHLSCFEDFTERILWGWLTPKSTNLSNQNIFASMIPEYIAYY